MKFECKFPIEELIILLDNSKVHISKESKRVLNSFWTTIVFTPVYSPQFAPIELFSIFWEKIYKQCLGFFGNVYQE